MRPLLIASGICATGALILVSAGVAGQPVTQPLNPPPPSFETCKALGNGTICQGTIAESYGPVDTSLACGSGSSVFDIFYSARHNELARRTYDANGNLLRRVRYDRYAGQLSNQLSGKTVPYTQTQTTTDDLGVPGDFGWATETLVGEMIARLPVGAPVLIGAGRAVFAPNGSIEFQAGPAGFLDLLTGSTSAVDPICTALGAS